MGASSASISVGPAGSGLEFHLVYDPSGGSTYIPSSPYGVPAYFGGNFRSSLDGATYEDGALHRTTVSFGGGSELFSDNSDGSHTNIGGGGGRLSGNSSSYVYTAADGTVATFGVVAPQSQGSGGTFGGTESTDLQTVVKPDGETLTYTYTQYTGPNGMFGATSTYARVQAVSSSRGYQIHLTYDATNPMVLTKATAINTTVDSSCSPSANVCGSLTQAWPALTVNTYAVNGAAWAVSITDPANRQTVYSIAGSLGLASIQIPGGPLITRTVLANTPIGAGSDYTKHVTVNDGAGTWTYEVQMVTDPTYQLQAPKQTKVINPLGKFRTVNLNWGLSSSDPSRGQVTDDTDELGHHTNIIYDSLGRTIQVTHPEGVQNQYNDAELYYRDARGNITSVLRNGKFGGTIRTQANYPNSCSDPGVTAATCNKPTATFDENNNETDYTYDVGYSNQVATVTGPPVNGVRAQTRFTYGTVTTLGGSVWRLLGTKTCRTMTLATCAGTADEVVTSIHYPPSQDAKPDTVTVSAGDGSLTATSPMAYDVFGNVTSITNPRGATTTYVYDAARQQTYATGPDPDGSGPLLGRMTYIHYRQDGQVDDVEQGTAAGMQQKLATGYDNAGRKTSDALWDGAGTKLGLTEYSYDQVSNLICTAVRLTLTAGAPCTPGVAADGSYDRITWNQYDDANRLTLVRQAYGTPGQIDYDTITYGDDGEKLTDKDAKGNLTTYAYDGFNRLFRAYYPLPGSPGASSTTDYEELAYDNASNITADRRRDGSILYPTYDVLGRQTTGANGAALNYDNLGNLTSASLNGATTLFYYDALGRKTGETGPLGTINYEYDLAGGHRKMIWPDGFYVTYDLDQTEAVTAIRENGATSGVGVLAQYGYDNLGRRTWVTRGNGVSTGYSYDNASRLAYMGHTLVDANYNQGLNFNYNAAGQVTARAATNTAYDFFRPDTAAATRAYTPNGLNQLINAAGNTITYDARGNLSNDGANTYSYNAVNQLISKAGAGSLAYDALGRLSQTSGSAVTRFAYDGNQLIGEYDAGGGLLRRYVPGPTGDEPILWLEGKGTSDRRWLIADQLGSVVGVTDATGAMSNGAGANSYDEYGLPGSSNTGRFQYTGQMWIPELGLYHYKARTYSPTLGRFLQTDPIGYGDGLNWYAYVGNDPINMVDPSGMAPGDCVPNNGGYVCDPHLPPAAPGCIGQLFCNYGPYTPPPQGLVVATGPPVGAGTSGGGLSQKPQNNSHLYDVAFKVCKQGAKCTKDSVYKCLTKNPAPYVSGAPAKDGQQINIPLFGPISVTTSPATQTIVNSTLPPHHLYPGYVMRSVISDSSGNIGVDTTGSGTGPLGSLNSLLAFPLWGLQTMAIAGCVALGGGQ